MDVKMCTWCMDIQMAYLHIFTGRFYVCTSTCTYVHTKIQVHMYTITHETVKSLSMATSALALFDRGIIATIRGEGSSSFCAPCSCFWPFPALPNFFRVCLVFDFGAPFCTPPDTPAFFLARVRCCLSERFSAASFFILPPRSRNARSIGNAKSNELVIP